MVCLRQSNYRHPYDYQTYFWADVKGEDMHDSTQMFTIRLDSKYLGRLDPGDYYLAYYSVDRNGIIGYSNRFHVRSSWVPQFGRFSRNYELSHFFVVLRNDEKFAAASAESYCFLRLRKLISCIVDACKVNVSWLEIKNTISLPVLGFVFTYGKDL